MKILVAFLEKPVAEAVSQILSDLGWPQPGIAETSDAAVEWINANGGCDLLICEVYLSPADGFTLRDTIQPHLPGLRTIFSSAYDISPYVDRLNGAPFLPQPVAPEALRQCLEELFPSESQPAPAPQPEPIPVAEPENPTPAPSVKVAVAATPKPSVAVSAQPKPSVAVKATPAVKVGPTTKPAAGAPKVAAATPKVTASAALPPQELPPDDLVGKPFGKFEIEARLAERDGATIYRARQTNVGRLVTLYLLDTPATEDPEKAAHFLADAKAKARLSHNRVAAIYEAGETAGRCFFSCEHIGAPSLEKFQAAGAKINGTTALEIVQMTADVLDTCEKQGIPHTPISDGMILLKPGSLPRMANIACEQAPAWGSTATDMKALGQMLLRSLDQSPDSALARQLALRLVQTESEPLSWPEVAAMAANAMPKAKPADVEVIQARDIAMTRVADESERRSKRNVIIGSSISLALTIAACIVIYFQITKSKVSVKDLGVLVTIPAGEFDFQGSRITLPQFYISKYEVSIAEYAEFLKFLEQNPEKALEFAHPDQPPGKSHIPTGWADMKEITPPMPGYYTRAKKWNSYQGAPLTVDGPVFGVDWFDAYAYAKWKGRRLPTEQEWEKAARGKRGGKHPWGNDQAIERANTGIDFTPNPDIKVGGEKDGFKRWSPVDKPDSDRSDYGVLNMGGNVSEWTASWTEDEFESGSKVPVYRGGNWKTIDEDTALRRGNKLTEFGSDDALGFRTASDTPE
jgi:formylglycine-generating enzyme required for sulfatase activity/CheY-like chemotaxis protein